MKICPKCNYKEPGEKEKQHLWDTYASLVLQRVRNKLKKEIGFGVPEEKEKEWDQQKRKVQRPTVKKKEKTIEGRLMEI
jgi:hypothetical protein